MGERIKITAKKPLSTKENSASNKQKTGFRSQSSHVDRILFLQRTIGNQAVQRLIKSGTLQAKLMIGQPGDKYEQEADRVAEEVMRMPEPEMQRQVNEEDEEEKLQTKTMAVQITPLVQRQIKTEEEEIIQTERASGRTPQVGHSLEAQIHHLRGGGQSLLAPTRAFFESRFGHDFSQVRVHTDSKAGETARSLNAKAFTIGKDVLFGSGEYSPETLGGRQLLAHELTHVIQQQARPLRIQRVSDSVVECNRHDAPACLLHLHGNETDALNVAERLYCTHCLNLVHINNPGRRLIHVDVTVGSSTFTCCADPNRIFSDSAINSDWNGWNHSPGVSFPRHYGVPAGMCENQLCRRHKAAAVAAVIAYRNNSLLPAINRCREGSGTVSEINTGTSVMGRPVIAFHNNTPGGTTPRGSLSIHSYSPGGREYRVNRATAVQARPPDQRLLQTAFNQLCQDHGHSNPPNPGCLCTGNLTNLRNPHIQTGRISDDFILVTNPDDFVAFVRLGRNVVLQAVAPRDDGSLSVLLRRERYINVEAQTGRRNEQEIMGREALDTALSLRGGLPCRSTPTGTGCPTCPPPTPSSPSSSTPEGVTTPSPSITPTPAPEQVQPSMQSVPEVRSQTPDTRVQRDTHPNNVQTEALRGQYSLNQFTPTAEQDWAEPIRSGFACNQLIQRRILIGSGTDQHEMNEQERSSFIQAVRGRTLNDGTQAHRELLFSQLQLTEHALQGMSSASEEYTFSNRAELVAEIVRRIIYPSNVRTEAQRRQYLLGQFTPTAGQDWVSVTLSGGRHSHLRREVTEAFGRMQQAARGAGHNLTLVSATRTFDDQLRIWNLKMQFDRSRGRFSVFEPTIAPVSTRCATILTAQDRRLTEWDTANANHRACWMALSEEEKALEVLKTSSAPGTSRHHWGTDIDLNSVDPQAWERSPLSGTYTWLTANAATYGFHQPYTPRQQRGNRGYFEEKWHWSYTTIAQPLLSEYRRLLFNPAEFRRGLQGRNVEAESFIVSHYQEYVGSVAQPSLLPVTRKDNRTNADNGGASQTEHHPNQTSPVTSNLETGINSMMGGGQPLSESVRAYFEPRFGQSFDQVRLHADSHAAEYADALGARAFTLGQDVFFGAGQFTPENATGRQLLAHELTHVIQQRHTGQQIQRHGDHSTITSAMDKYRHTFAHVGISQSTWESGFGSANFLGVHISGGVHQELADSLVDAETFLRTRYPGLSDSDIATPAGRNDLIQCTRPASTFTQRISQPTTRTAYDRCIGNLEDLEDLEDLRVDCDDEYQLEDWVSANFDTLAGEARQYIEIRLQEVNSRGFPSGVLASGDEDWVQHVIEMLTGQSYDTANRLYGGPGGWREEYERTGDYPIASVCDQLGELIQWIRGVTGYGGGLTAHYEYYHNRGLISTSPTAAMIQPGATLFHVVQSGTSHALDIAPWNRVPTESWSAEAARRLRQQQNRLLGHGWSRDTVQGLRGEPSRADSIGEFDRQLDQIYHCNRKLVHESTILRVMMADGQHWIQLFDFADHVAQEGSQWFRASAFMTPERHWAYQPTETSQMRYLGAPRSEGYITISCQDKENRIDISAGSLLHHPASHYLWAISGTPYTDWLDVELTLMSGGFRMLQATEEGAMWHELTEDQRRRRGRAHHR